jgi:hypothetical protein
MLPHEIVLRLARKGDSIEIRAESQIGERKAEVPLSFLKTPFQRAVHLALGALEFNPLRWKDDPELSQAFKELGFVDKQGPGQNLHEMVGARLFEELFSSASKVLEALHEALRAGTGDHPSRVELRIPHDETELDALPWELLYESTTRPFLFRGRKASLVRYIECDLEKQACDLLPNANLLLVAPRPFDENCVDLRDIEGTEIESILVQFRPSRVRFSRLPRKPGKTTWDLLSEYLLNKGNPVPHILHFDCHGAFGRKCSGESCGRLHPPGTRQCSCGRMLGERDEGYLAFEKKNRRPDWIEAHRLGTLLGGCGIRLCVLSACHSAKSGGESVFCGIGPSLIRAAIPMVVAMQSAVSDKSAEEFTKAFYTSIAQGESTASAVAKVRAVMRDDAEWYSPVLYLRTEGDNREGNLLARVAADSKTREWARVPSPEPAPEDPDCDTCKTLHWDRESIVKPFVHKIKNRDDPMRVIAVQGQREAGFDSLHERLAQICKKAARKAPLLRAKLEIDRLDVAPIVATRLFDRLFETALAEGMLEARSLLKKQKVSMKETIMGQPEPSEVASTFTELLAEIESQLGVVLLLRAPSEKLKPETEDFLRVMTICSQQLEDFLIVLTSEGAPLEFLTKDVPNANKVVLYFPELPTITDDQCLDWAHALGLTDMGIETARGVNNSAHHDPVKIREYLDLLLTVQACGGA